MAVTSPKAVSRCPRCLKAIAQGAAIEPIGTDANGKRVWAHAGCQQVSAITPPPAAANGHPAPRPDVVAVPPAGEKSIPQSDWNRAVSRAVDAVFPQLCDRVRAETTDDLNRKIERFIGESKDTIVGVQEWLQNENEQHVAVISEAMRLAREAMLAEAKKVQQKVVAFQTATGGTVNAAAGEVFNEAFDEIMELAEAGENVFIPGPTGCGKTHVVEQLARYIRNPDGTVGREYHVIAGTAGVTEADIKGTAIPNLTTGENVYVSSRFVELYENGGVVLVDEADAMDSNCLLTLNAAIANRFMPVPKRASNPVAKMHPQFVCVFAANTYGHGADRQYVGRNKLDAATLDRFCNGFVPMNYSEAVEMSLCPDMELYATLKQWRANIFTHRLQRFLSTRFVAGAYRATQRGRDLAYIAKKLTADQGWSPDETRKVLGNTL